jgi:hypothetical protein
VVNALTGAALGAGTKLIIDKITGKPTVAKDSNTGSKTPNISSGKGVPPNSNSAKVAAANAAAKKAADEKAAAAKAKADAAKNPTSVIKNPEGGTPADPSLGLPEGAIDNGDGTYTVGNTTYSMEDGTRLYVTDEDGKLIVSEDAKNTTADNVATDEETRLAQEEGLGVGETMEYGNGTTITALDDGNGGIMYVRGGYDTETGLGPKGGGTRGLGGGSTDTTDTTETGDTTVAGGDTQYFQDDYGNVYTMNEDGSYELYSDAGGTTGDGSDYADNTYVDPDTGQTWTMADDGTWSSDEDTSYADNTYTDPDTGAVYTMADNGEWTTDWTDDTDYSNVDYSIYADNDYNVNNDDSSYYTGYDDEEYAKRGGLITMMNKGGVAKFEDGGYVDNGDGTYSIGNFTYDMETDEYLYSTDSDSGNITNVSPDAVYSTTAADDYYDTDSLGNIFKNGELYRAAEVPEDITSAGGGERPWYSDLGNVLTKGATSAAGLGRGALDSITGALGTTAGAAGAGALVATLLGQDFGGGTGNQNQGLDMSQVGLINPRTTDFGIGPTRFVGYEDYGTSGDEYTPNEELLRNLNAPGYNPVNEGDYGYEEVAADEAEATPKMASGGLSSMATPVASYYTFGQPADILANLGMRPQPPVNPPEMMPQIGQQRPPDQAQQQGLPQQQPPQMTQQMPQGMPQQGMMPQQQGMAPPMRKGGLPHASDVPMVEGRMDFRRGSAVHGAGDGQSDDIPAMLADGEYVIDAETVAQIGNGSTKAGAQALDKFREGIRAHKRSAPVNKIPPKTKALTSYLKGAK